MNFNSVVAQLKTIALHTMFLTGTTPRISKEGGTWLDRGPSRAGLSDTSSRIPFGSSAPFSSLQVNNSNHSHSLTGLSGWYSILDFEIRRTCSAFEKNVLLFCSWCSCKIWKKVFNQSKRAAYQSTDAGTNFATEMS